MSESLRAPAGSRTARERTERAIPVLLASALGATALVTSVPAAPEQQADQRGGQPSSASTRVPTAPVPVRTAVLGAPVRVLTATPTYAVQPGDTVSHIAARLGTTVAAIVELNGLDDRAFILAGQVLNIPGADAPPPAAEPAAPAPASSAQHAVVSGDTVGAIAARYGTTAAAVVAANGLDSRAFIRVGQVLAIPGAGGATPASAPVSAPVSAPAPAEAPAATGGYTVVSGDTLSGIAARTGTTVDALRAANPDLDSASTILVGQVIQVPGGSSLPPLPNTFAGRTYPDATVQAATANRDVLAARPAPSREEMQQVVAETAAANGVDPALAQAISFQESGFNMRAVSPANAVGAMQVIPSSGQWASMLAGRPIDLLDARDNALAGVLILRAHAATGADEPTVIAAYYQGMGGVQRYGMYPDTRRYVASVQTLMGQYR